MDAHDVKKIKFQYNYTGVFYMGKISQKLVTGHEGKYFRIKFLKRILNP
jgi:hypothetical protein